MNLHLKGPVRPTVMALVLVTLAALSGCDTPEATPPAASEPMAAAMDDTAVEHALKHADPKYICPMHPQIVKDEPGDCPICGMDLVAKAVASEPMAAAMDDTAVEHALKHTDPKYICPMHPQIVRDEPGDCPICGMDLVAKAVASEPMAAAMDDTAVEHALKHTDPKYICPMHPQIVKDEPGDCPICGMDLVAKRTEVPASGRPVVSISARVVQNMGVRTARVESGTLQKSIRTLGRIDYDETRLAHIHPRAEGWMERLLVRAEGDPVRQGQVLGYLYSPSILAAQVDFLIAMGEAGRRASAAKVDKARNLLRLLDVPESVIKAIEREGQTRNTVPMLSPISGVVTRLGAREGMYITPSSEVYTIADLSQVWVQVDVFEHQLDALSTGLSAEIRLPARPGRVWAGEVDYIYPELDPQTRTLRVRLSFPNPELLLKPNMFAEVVILGSPRTDVLTIPREALIVTGERESVVKALGEGRFQPVDVVTGMREGDRVEVLSGLGPGDEIVVSGQFLIDSESSLQASFRRMMEP